MLNLMEISKKDLIIALEESITLQSHYAGLLNLYDEGQRLQFKDAEEWILRLMECNTIEQDKRRFVQKFHREGSYKPEEIFPLVGPGDREFNGKIVDMNSDRYWTFKKNNCICVSCGIKGEVFHLEKNILEINSNPLRFHFNLYAMKDGFEVLMTKDHIIPKSKGGKNHISNYQTMCQKCNINKGVNYEKKVIP